MIFIRKDQYERIKNNIEKAANKFSNFWFENKRYKVFEGMYIKRKKKKLMLKVGKHACKEKFFYRRLDCTIQNIKNNDCEKKEAIFDSDFVYDKRIIIREAKNFRYYHFNECCEGNKNIYCTDSHLLCDFRNTRYESIVYKSIHTKNIQSNEGIKLKKKLNKRKIESITKYISNKEINKYNKKVKKNT